MAILKYRDKDGNIVEIPAIKGDKGDKGDPGVSGVYVGAGEAPADCNVQIDPTGEFTMPVMSVNGQSPDANGNIEVGTTELQPLTFTGAVEATYDGTTPVTVDIPNSGGGSEYELVETITLEEDVNLLNITIANPANNVVVVFEGRINDADDTLTTGEAVMNIKRKRYDQTFYAGNLAHIKPAGTTLKSSCLIEKRWDNVWYVETARALRSDSDSINARYSFNSTDPISTLCIFITSTDHFFKAGGIFKIYRR